MYIFFSLLFFFFFFFFFLNFRTFDKIVNRQKDEAKINYFQGKFWRNKNDLKKTWNVIDESLNRHSKKADFPGEFKHNSETINQPVDIANPFNTFFPELEKICPIALMLTTSFMEHTKNIFGPQPI